MPHAIIIRTAGSNCDQELAHAFRQAGATVQVVHLNVLLEEPRILDRADLIGIPGGFSYGDDVAAGAIFALLLRERLYPTLRSCVERGVPIFAPCNGFQVLVKLGLLPGPMDGAAWPSAEPPPQTVTLAPNTGGRFIDDWVRIETIASSPCIWTRNLQVPDDTTMILPIAHGEGRFVADAQTIKALEADGRVALRYRHEADNLNGSINRIAGICDPSGLVFGLMPHPERFTKWTQHPSWTRLPRSTTETATPIGLQMFRNAVQHVANPTPA